MARRSNLAGALGLLRRRDDLVVGEVHRGHGRHTDVAAEGEFLHLHFLGLDGPAVELVGTIVLHAVRIEELRQRTAVGQADAVFRIEGGGEIRHRQDGVALLVRAGEGDHGMIAVVGLDPLEAIPAVIDLVEGRSVAVDLIQAADALLHLRMTLILEQEPIQLVIEFPLDEVTEFTAHEQQLLAGMGHGVAVEHPQAREFLPQVAGLLVQHGMLAVHDLVVAEGQHIIVAEGVHQGEGDLVMVVLAVDRILLNVGQHVVHPAHVPLEVEAQTAQVHGLRDHGEGVAFLGDHHRTGEIPAHDDVQIPQEIDRIQVLVAAILVGQPLTRLAAEIVVQHGRHRIHAQAVRMIPLQPEAGVGHQEGPHLTAGEVKHMGAPLGHVAAAGIGMLIAGGAVKAAQAGIILGEMGGHPVDDDADTSLMQPVDQVHQLVGLAVAGGRCIIAADLIAPGHIQGMLHHGEELHVGVVHVQDVGDQLIRDLPVGQELTLRIAPPGAQVQLIDVHGRAEHIARLTLFHPLRVMPFVLGQVAELGAGVGAHLHRKSIGVGLVVPYAVAVAHSVLVGDQALRRFGETEPLRITGHIEGLRRDADLPCAVVLLDHGGRFTVPIVEFTDQRNCTGIRRPHGEMPILLALLLHRMGAQHFVCAPVRALMKRLPDLFSRAIVAHQRTFLHQDCCMLIAPLFQRKPYPHHMYFLIYY